MEEAVEASVAEATEPSLFEAVIRWAILGLVFLLPLAVNPWGFQPYTLIKVTILRLFLLTALLFWLLQAVIRGRFAISISRLHPFIAFYILFASISTLLSVSPATSIFGWFMRYEGLLALIGYGLIFVICYEFFSEFERALELLTVLLLSSTLIGIYGFFEFFGYSLFSALIKDPSRIASLFGNPGYLGGFLTLAIPVSVAFILGGPRFSRLRYLAAANLALTIPLLVLSHTKSAWVGTGVGLAMLGLKFYRRFDKKIMFVGIAAVLIIIFMVTAAGMIGNHAAEKKSAAIAHVNLDTSGRFLYWRVALASIAKRPFFGWGPDTFSFVYQKNRPADWLKFDKENALVDKSHNDFLQVGVTTGLPGLFAYLAFLFVLIGGLVKGPHDDGDKTVLIWGLLASMVAYLIFIQAYFSIAELAPFFWGFAAIASGLKERGVNRRLQFELSAFFTRAVVAVVLLAAATGILFTLRAQAADYHFNRGFDLADTGNWSQVADENRAAVWLDPTRTTYRLYLGLSLLNEAYGSRSASDFAEAEKAYKDAVKSDPELVDGYVGLGNTYLAENEILKKNSLRKALTVFERADNLAQYSPVIKSKIGVVLTGLGEKKEALDILKKVIVIQPDNYKNYVNLSDCYLRFREYRQAELVLLRALRRWPKEKEVRKKLNVIVKESM